MGKCTDDDVIFRPALYIGSFVVEDGSQVARVNKVQSELEARWAFKQYKQLLVCVSTRGIKICSLDTKVVYMAHAIRRVSYATCDAVHRQVVFLAREPRGQANLQYCHVFVTEDSAKAEELNRIIGDAFQLAYARQYLSRMQQAGNQTTPTNGAGSTDTDQPQQGLLFRLTDRHSRWPVEKEAERDSHTVTSEPTSCYRIELPPPPDCPPPPPVPDGEERHSFSNQQQGSSDLGSAQSAVVPGPLNSRLGSPERPSDCGVTATEQQQNNLDKTKPDDLTDRLRRISTSQISDATFLRKHFLRRSEGKGPLPSTSGDAATGRVMSSLFQPVRRRHGLSDLFRSSARHSAFFPSTMMRDILPATTESHLSDSSEPMEPGRRSRRKPAPSTPHKSPPFILDLRTFYGGSPVVALKERLDAEAVAEAKARALAEAAAVLAAAKLASSRAAGAATLSPNSSSSANSVGPLSSSEGSIDGPLSNGVASGASDHHLRQQNQSSWSDPLAPIPPTRMLSLPRHRQPPGSHNRNSAFDTAQGVMPGGRGLAPTMPPERVYDQTAADDDEDGRGELIATRSACSGIRRTGVGANVTHRLSLVDSQMHAFSTVRTPVLLDKRTLANTTTGLHRSHSPPKTPTNRPGFTGRNLATTSQSVTTAANYHAPLHVIADSRLRRQQQPATTNTTAGGMVSTETPTPTPTVTPTPTQTLGSGTDEVDLLLRRAQLPREIAFDLLTREEVGSFLIRNSVTYPDCSALSVRVPKQDNPTGITHYLIQRTQQGGVRLKGLDKEWPSLSALITHLTVIPEMLPCPLRLPVHSNNPTFTQVDNLQPHVTAATLIQRQGHAETADNLADRATTLAGYHTTTANTGGGCWHQRYAAEDPPNNRHQQQGGNTQELRTSEPVASAVGVGKRRWVPKMENGAGRYTDSGDDDEDEDYQRLSDFSSLLADLKQLPTASAVTDDVRTD